ncbi:HTTM domain-containing protein [Halorussus amylolyticus]|uniref:HTTM domain-containing protein n=1 Tax=Halorussus amylolyticus TaxID=1126242 RepID=UPI001EE4137F|nr:HTTM domain-containing protein [Halorussus amylolyticus]
MDTREIARRLHERSRSAVARRLGIDARALAAFRVTLGLLLFVDLLLRSRDLVAFYTDVGVLPRTALREGFPILATLSIHTISGAAWVQVVLFLLAGVSALALVVGHRTTLAATVSWLLLVSLHARNPLVLSAGDSLLRRLLFWGLFLPLGARWSVDSLRAEAASRNRVVSAATAALLLQVVVVYAVNAAFKLRGDRWIQGDAVRYVFSLDQFTVLFGDFVAQFPALLVAFDWVWLAMLACSPLLVVLTGRRRIAFASLFAAMHLGMALTMNLGLFPFIALVGLIPFLPARVWDAVGPFWNVTVRFRNSSERFRNATSRFRNATDRLWNATMSFRIAARSRASRPQSCDGNAASLPPSWSVC